MSQLHTNQQQLAIQAYCDWLNRHEQENSVSVGWEPYNFTPAEFAGQGGAVTELARCALGGGLGEEIVVYSAGYGDDGGPAVLTCYFSSQPGDTVASLDHMTQLFDTYLTVVVREGALASVS